MKFQPNSLISIQLTERTKNCIKLCYKWNNLKNKHARVMVLVHDTSSECALQMYEVSLKYLYDDYQVIEWTQFCDGQIHGQTQGGKIYVQELWFLCITRHLNVLYKCLKFRWNTYNGYQVIVQTRSSIANDQREITPKKSKPELWILCMTYCALEVYKFSTK